MARHRLLDHLFPSSEREPEPIRASLRVGAAFPSTDAPSAGSLYWRRNDFATPRTPVYRFCPMIAECGLRLDAGRPKGQGRAGGDGVAKKDSGADPGRQAIATAAEMHSQGRPRPVAVPGRDGFDDHAMIRADPGLELPQRLRVIGVRG